MRYNVWMTDTLTQSRLKDLIHYDPHTGAFTWAKARPGAALGAPCGRVSKTTGYRDIGVDKKLHRANRLAWLYMTGEWPDGQVDHKNRIKHDDRWDNLRLATRSQNGANVDTKESNTSGHVGVSWDKGRQKWLAQIRIGGIKKNLGRFTEKADAIAKYQEAAKSEFGEFSNA